MDVKGESLVGFEEFVFKSSSMWELSKNKICHYYIHNNHNVIQLPGLQYVLFFCSSSSFSGDEHFEFFEFNKSEIISCSCSSLLPITELSVSLFIFPVSLHGKDDNVFSLEILVSKINIEIIYSENSQINEFMLPISQPSVAIFVVSGSLYGKDDKVLDCESSNFCLHSFETNLKTKIYQYS